MALAFVMVVAACGGGGASTTTATPAVSTFATTTSDVPPELGSVRTDRFGIEQVWVPAGTFRRGSDDPAGLEIPQWANAEWSSEQPAHDVTITTGFWIDRLEVTNAAFAAFVAGDGYTTQAYWSDDGWEWVSRRDPDRLPADCATSDDDHPRACITWFEAEAYAAWRGGRLPTEAEWEFAARGPESLVFPWGNDWDASRTNLVDSEGTVPVGSYPAGASWVGALDMTGNVMEWVSDWWSFTYYEEEVGTDPQGPPDGVKKVEKGGWWGSVPFVGRAAYRHFEDPPTYRDEHIGVRIVTVP